MKFWQALSYERTEFLVPLAKTCEELGFEGVLLADHVVGHAEIESKYPYSYNDGESNFVAQTEFPETFAAICAMAAVTSRLRFNTQIYIAPLRHPIHLAKSLATASVLSQGRVVLGAGVGWLREEFTALGEDFDNRGRRLDEMIAVMRKLWSGDMVEHRGEFYAFDALRMLPAPVVPVPIMVGGLHPRVLERAGALCDGWITPGNTPEEFDAIYATIERHRADHGRSEGPFEYIVAAPEPGQLEQYRDRESHQPCLAVVNHPLSFAVGPEATLSERQAELERYAAEVAIGA